MSGGIREGKVEINECWGEGVDRAYRPTSCGRGNSHLLCTQFKIVKNEKVQGREFDGSRRVLRMLCKGRVPSPWCSDMRRGVHRATVATVATAGTPTTQRHVAGVCVCVCDVVVVLQGVAYPTQPATNRTDRSSGAGSEGRFPSSTSHTHPTVPRATVGNRDWLHGLLPHLLQV